MVISPSGNAYAVVAAKLQTAKIRKNREYFPRLKTPKTLSNASIKSRLGLKKPVSKMRKH